MRFCYLDESGTAELSGPESHFVLLGLSIPGTTWKIKDQEVTLIKRRYGLERAEVHAGWLARRYVEQERIADFENLSTADRRKEVQTRREAILLRKAALRGPASVQGDRKNFAKTAAYIHLTLTERRQLLRDLADKIDSWDDCRLFAECIDKTTFGGRPPRVPPYEEAFEQVVSRFHRFLEVCGGENGLLLQDQNQTVMRRLTEMMRAFHERGTRWTSQIGLIVETPLFVSSDLTSMVQMADVCAYATRRFCDYRETDLFDRIFSRFNRVGTRLVGVRHYTNRSEASGRWCSCRICAEH